MELQEEQNNRDNQPKIQQNNPRHGSNWSTNKNSSEE
jgi:hypothetical protein